MICLLYDHAWKKPWKLCWNIEFKLRRCRIIKFSGRSKGSGIKVSTASPEPAHVGHEDWSDSLLYWVWRYVTLISYGSITLKKMHLCLTSPSTLVFHWCILLYIRTSATMLTHNAPYLALFSVVVFLKLCILPSDFYSVLIFTFLCQLGLVIMLCH